MPKNPLSPQAYDRLMTSILDIITANGLRATTMDMVAAKLQMSKRTLYEIFGCKEDMIAEVLRIAGLRSQAEYKRLYESSATVLEAMVRIMAYNRDNTKTISPAFFRDLDNLPPKLRDKYRAMDKERQEEILKTLELGVEQGVFRPDANYRALLGLIRVQMESLKRMEEFFPPDITTVDALDMILAGFLRSVATPKGMEILHQLLPNPYKLTLKPSN